MAEVIFFDDDDFNNVSSGIEDSWGKIGMTEIRICDYKNLEKCEILG